MEKFYELSISGEESKLHKMIVPAMIISLFLAAGIGGYIFFVEGSKHAQYHYVTDPLKRGNLELTATLSNVFKYYLILF